MSATALERSTSSVADEYVLKLLLSRLVGQPAARTLTHTICHLVGALYEIDGPFYAGSQADAVNGRITAQWQAASAKKKGNGLLADETLDRYFPPRIRVAIQEVIADGPTESVQAVETYLAQAATGRDDEGNELLDEETGEPIEVVSSSFVKGRLRAARKLVDELIQLRILGKQYGLTGELDEWRKDNVPKWPTARTLNAKAKRLVRSAPPLEYVRCYFRQTTREINKRLSRTGRRRHEKMFGLLRARVLVLLCALGLRKGTIRRLLIEDFIPEYPLMPGMLVPALRLRHLKSVSEAERIFPIPRLFASWITQYLDYIAERGYTPDKKQPLILPKRPDCWAGYMQHPSSTMIYVAVVRALAPFAGGRMYSPHTLRHLAEQYAVRAGADWLNQHEHDKDTLPRPSGVGVPIGAQTFADYVNDHVLNDVSDRYGDRDNEDARRWWRWVTAEGMCEYYCGKRGAPKGLDLDAIRLARERVQELTADQVKRQARIEKLRRDRDALEQQKVAQREIAVRDAAQLDEVARFRVQMELDGVNDRINALQRQIEHEQDALPALRERLTNAHAELHAASKTLVPVADEVQPVLSLDVSELGVDDALVEQDAFTERPILRREFELIEFHRALGGRDVISIEQLRRYARGESAWQSLFDDDGTGKPKGVWRPHEKSHKCFIAFDDLPLERYPAEVIERLEALMREQPRALKPVP